MLAAACTTHVVPCAARQSYPQRLSTGLVVSRETRRRRRLRPVDTGRRSRTFASVFHVKRALAWFLNRLTHSLWILVISDGWRISRLSRRQVATTGQLALVAAARANRGSPGVRDAGDPARTALADPSSEVPPAETTWRRPRFPQVPSRQRCQIRSTSSPFGSRCRCDDKLDATSGGWVAHPPRRGSAVKSMHHIGLPPRTSRPRK